MPDCAGIPPVLVTPPAEHKSLPVRSTMLGWSGLDHGISLQDPGRLTDDQEEDLIAQLRAYAPRLDLLAAEPHIVRVA